MGTLVSDTILACDKQRMPRDILALLEKPNIIIQPQDPLTICHDHYWWGPWLEWIKQNPYPNITDLLNPQPEYAKPVPLVRVHNGDLIE